MAFRFDFGAGELDDVPNEPSADDDAMDTEPTTFGLRSVVGAPSLEATSDSAKDAYVEIPLEQLVSPHYIP